MARRTVSLLLATLAVALAACAGPATPTPSPAPSGGPVVTAEDAVARVIAHEPRLAGIGPRDPALIGQSAWYDVAPGSGVGVFVVSVRVGWGDCPAGCIDEHTWLYAVGPDGSVTLQSETGEPVPADAWPSPDGDGRTGLRVIALAGPTCPAETVPPDPACAPRPVPGASVSVGDASGTVVAEVVLDPAGVATIALPPGDYVVSGVSTGGFPTPPQPQSVTVGASGLVDVTLAYDTGIR